MIRANRKARAATLFEILMIMFILSLMIAFLVPAIGGGHNEKQRVECVQHMKEIVRVGMIYANDDSKSILGPVHPLALQFLGDGFAEYGGGPGWAPFTRWDEEFAPDTRQYNQLIFGKGGFVPSGSSDVGGQFELFRCPGHDLGWQSMAGWIDEYATERPYFLAYGVSFRMNNLNYGNGVELGIRGRPITRIPQTAETLAFMEARAFQTVFTNDAWGVGGPFELTGYHGKPGFFNVAYVDGHADYADFGFGTYYAQLPSLNMYNVRGSWGRMDCLPDAPYSDNMWRQSLGDNPTPMPTRTRSGF